MRDDVRTKVKIAVPVEKPGVPCWPCIDYNVDKELNRVLEPIKELNPNVDFTVVKYTERSQAEKDYENDLKEYNGILVLLMTCWKDLTSFYADKMKEGGLPVIVADVPYFGSGSMLCEASVYVRKNKLPVPLISSLDYTDIAKAVNLLRVIHLMKETKILVVTDRASKTEYEDKISSIWGCKFVNKTAREFNQYYDKTDIERAKQVAKLWKDEAVDTIEPSDEELIESAKVYLALETMKNEVGADAITVDCLTLSYSGQYSDKNHMYPCLSHYEMMKHNIVAVCEADLNATITSLLTLYLTGKQGFVSDPVIDTSSNQIIYAHCVACNKVYGCSDSRKCNVYIRSHAEDQKGASVQVIFPAGEKLTTLIVRMEGDEKAVGIHSAVSVGNVGGDEGCRSKLAAVTDAEKVLHNWLGGWHRVTVFGDYKKLFAMLFKMKEIDVIEEDI